MKQLNEALIDGVRPYYSDKESSEHVKNNSAVLFSLLLHAAASKDKDNAQNTIFGQHPYDLLDDNMFNKFTRAVKGISADACVVPSHVRNELRYILLNKDLHGLIKDTCNGIKKDGKVVTTTYSDNVLVNLNCILSILIIIKQHPMFTRLYKIARYYSSIIDSSSIHEHGVFITDESLLHARYRLMLHTLQLLLEELSNKNIIVSKQHEPLRKYRFEFEQLLEDLVLKIALSTLHESTTLTDLSYLTRARVEYDPMLINNVFYPLIHLKENLLSKFLYIINEMITPYQLLTLATDVQKLATDHTLHHMDCVKSICIKALNQEKPSQPDVL
jgi:competence protein ComGF